MHGSCAHDSCALQSTVDGDLCVLHVRREGKGREDLVAAIEELDALGVVRVYGVDLRGANLSGLVLYKKNFQGSDLSGADLSNARLEKVGFDESTLEGVDFEGAILQRVDLRRTTSLRGIRWYETILDGVRVPEIRPDELECCYAQGPERDLEKATYVYRCLKEAYKRQGNHDVAGLLYEREMTMRLRIARGRERLWLGALWALCGFGERPLRAVGVFLVSILAFGLAYMPLELQGADGLIQGDFLESLYFSTVTFSTLGYGDIRPVGFARLLACTETLLGVFTISLFVFVFCRRMLR